MFLVGDDGEPIHASKRHRHRFNDAAMQEAQDIFGLDFDVGDFDDLEEEDDYEEGVSWLHECFLADYFIFHVLVVP